MLKIELMGHGNSLGWRGNQSKIQEQILGGVIYWNRKPSKSKVHILYFPVYLFLLLGFLFQ